MIETTVPPVTGRKVQYVPLPEGVKAIVMSDLELVSEEGEQQEETLPSCSTLTLTEQEKDAMTRILGDNLPKVLPPESPTRDPELAALVIKGRKDWYVVLLGPAKRTERLAVLILAALMVKERRAGAVEWDQARQLLDEARNRMKGAS